MRLPPVQPRSRLAHQAAHWARSLGRFNDYHAAVFRAFFERGEDIGETGVLQQLAADSGLDPAGLRAALERRAFEPGVLADERQAAELSVGGVPAFVANRRLALSGVQSLEGLRELADRVRALRG